MVFLCRLGFGVFGGRVPGGRVSRAATPPGHTVCHREPDPGMRVSTQFGSLAIANAYVGFCKVQKVPPAETEKGQCEAFIFIVSGFKTKDNSLFFFFSFFFTIL